MLFRFSLYGFLKNQAYYEPFLVLAFLDKGMSFFQIGLLIAFREICINLIEVPSGALADLYGRRRAMMISFAAYIGSFVIFAFSETYWHFFPAMLLFATGEAFRTGTHKALIFTWLRQQGRTDEKTKIYGYTRSWSKVGSAVSVVLATAFVLVTKNYSAVFLFSIIPYMLGLANFMTYPKALDAEVSGSLSVRAVIEHLRDAFRLSFRSRALRRLILESMGFEGMFKASKDYIQPVLKAAALSLPVMASFQDEQRSAVLIGLVYFLLYTMSVPASRRAHKLPDMLGGEEKASRVLWGAALVVYAALTPLLFLLPAGRAAGPVLIAGVVVGFIALYLMQNLWRPILISRFDHHASDERGATVLSIENQAKSVATMIIAPCLGYAADLLRDLQQSGAYTRGEFWPVAALGAVIAFVAFVTAKHTGNEEGKSGE